VTIPHKETLFAGLARLDASARAAGAVNTVRFVDGEPEGFNTDGEGWLRACEEEAGAKLEGRTVCVLGSGGSARAVATTAARAGAIVEIVARRAEKAAELAEQCRRAVPASVVTIAADDSAIGAADVVVNCTPLGMRDGDVSPWNASHFRSGQFFMDLVYVRPVTLLMGLAEQASARTANGLGMLLHQGGRQYEIWTGGTPDLAAMRGALEKAVYGR
jgi:shikimate dehydrogenase